MPAKSRSKKKSPARSGLRRKLAFSKLQTGLLAGALILLGLVAVAVTQASAVPCTNSCVAIMSSPGIGNTGYWVVGGDGGVFSYGTAGFYGSMGGKPLNRPMAGGAATPSGGGYWLVAGDGGIFPFGNAPGYGSLPGRGINVSNIVGMARTPNGAGYWVVGADGAVYAFGSAPYKGGMNGSALNGPIVGIASSPSGQGYWMLGSDGGIFPFGDAAGIKSFAGASPSFPFTAIGAMPTSQGYWGVGSDGGVFTAGTAGFYGSTGGGSVRGVRGFAVTNNGQGYWILSGAGVVYLFGNAGMPNPTPTPAPATPRLQTPAPVVRTPTPVPPRGGTTPVPKPGQTRSGPATGTTTIPVTPPATPTDFKSSINEGSAAVSLSWLGSAASYTLERSNDNATWQVLAIQPSTSYDDKATTFDVHYYYRVKGVNSELNSNYATTDITTPKFSNNTAGGVTITSDDGLVSVAIPEGAFSGDASCSIVTGSSYTDSLQFDKRTGIAAGPYSLVCQLPDGSDVTEFLKPLTTTVALTEDLAKGYKTFKVLEHKVDDDSGNWNALSAQADKKNRNFSFEMTTPLDFVVLGTHGAAIPWGVIIFILLILGVGGAIFFFIQGRGQATTTKVAKTRKYYEY